MKENFFTTNITMFTLIIFALALMFIYLELHYNAKGALGVVGGLLFLLGIALGFIMGIPIIELAVMLVVSTILVIAMLTVRKNKEIK